MLSGCVTARMHSPEELNVVANECGLALGQVAQDEEEKTTAVRDAEQADAAATRLRRQWARKNHLKAVFIEGMEFAQ